MTAELPDPLVPPEVDLRDFPFMPLEISRLRRSKAWTICRRNPVFAFYWMNLWTASWHDSPPGSLEDDDDVLCDAAMCDPSKWKKLRAQILRGWVKCSDGRLYHPIVAEKALEAWERRQEFQTKGDNKAGRQKRWRDRLSVFNAQLRALGIAPPKGASLAILERMLAEAEETPPPSLVDTGETPTASTEASTVDKSEIGCKGREETGRYTSLGGGSNRDPDARDSGVPPPLEFEQIDSSEEPAYLRSDDHKPLLTGSGIDVDLPPLEDRTATQQALIDRCLVIVKLLRDRGAGINASNPHVVGWASSGITDAQILQALEIAESRRHRELNAQPINAGYLNAILRDLKRNPVKSNGAAPVGSQSTRDRSLVDDLTDTSWAN